MTKEEVIKKIEEFAERSSDDAEHNQKLADKDGHQFALGENSAFIECLEILKMLS